MPTADTDGAAGFVLAIDFGGTKIDVATAGPDGAIRAARRLTTDPAAGARAAVERAVRTARELAAAAGGPCLAAGAVSPGIVREDRVLLAPNVPGWEELPLPGLLRDGLGLDVVAVDTDVKAAALAEARRGALRGADPGIFYGLGTGIAAAIVTGGRVLRGAHGAAGEVGYSLVGDGPQPAARAGHAPLEELAGGRAIGDRATAALGEPVSAEEAFARAAAGDPRARAVVEGAVTALAAHVANLAVALDPERIAVGGGLAGAADVLLPALEARLREAVPFPPELVLARFTTNAPLHGAIALALEAARDGAGAGRLPVPAESGEARA
ncbi:MAG: ROK family protein [Solirubrobacterales bacterium]|nr:ROK family protein [Solirubrobacterales bacterium]